MKATTFWVIVCCGAVEVARTVVPSAAVSAELSATSVTPVTAAVRSVMGASTFEPSASVCSELMVMMRDTAASERVRRLEHGSAKVMSAILQPY